MLPVHNRASLPLMLMSSILWVYTIQLVCGDWYILVKVDNPSREAPVRCIEVSKKERKKKKEKKKKNTRKSVMVMSTFIITNGPILKGPRIQKLPNFVVSLNNRPWFLLVSAQY